ncbi:MAG: DNA repair protein RadA, partial [Halothiobacillus sp.]|nr:DNA repair protein RadA [Halothiobacillus sp.]
MARAREKSAFVCQECGADFPKWAGRCSECGAWNSLNEIRLPGNASTASSPGVSGYAGGSPQTT